MLYWLMRVICGHGVGNMGGGGGIGMIVGLPILLVVLMPAGVRVSRVVRVGLPVLSAVAIPAGVMTRVTVGAPTISPEYSPAGVTGCVGAEEYRRGDCRRWLPSGPDVSGC